MMNLLAGLGSKSRLPGSREHRSLSAWNEANDPERVLIIRFHAVGDVALVLPACQGLRLRYPDAQIDLLTSSSAAPLAASLHLFDTVIPLRDAGPESGEADALLSTAYHLRQIRYRVVLDLQRNWKSRFIRRVLRPASWGEFDRFSLRAACERTLNTFHETGFRTVLPSFGLEFKPRLLQTAESLLRAHGWERGVTLVLFNPAGLWPSRQWPRENYVQLARAWPAPRQVQFLLIGTERLREASCYFGEQLGPQLIDLSGRTALDVAFALLKYVDVAVTEDSGLMHMAWAVGTPLVALFGSSRHVWSLPTGDRVRAFHSGDLPCGACMRPQCMLGDTRCLTRVTPESVLHALHELLRHRDKESPRG